MDLSLGIPGNTGILWLGLLVSGRLIVKRNGAALAMGASTALWGIPLGLDNSLTYNLAIYGLVGGALDLLVKIPAVHLDHPLGAALCGGLAHLTKLGFITAYAMSFGLYRNFLELGMFTSAGLHFVFGALGGLAAVVAIKTVKRVRQGRQQNSY